MIDGCEFESRWTDIFTTICCENWTVDWKGRYKLHRWQRRRPCIDHLKHKNDNCGHKNEKWQNFDFLWMWIFLTTIRQRLVRTVPRFFFLLKTRILLKKERASLSSRYTVSVLRPHNFCYNDLSLNKQNLSFNNEDDWWRSIKQKEYLLTF